MPREPEFVHYTGKQCREMLYDRKKGMLRTVPAFTYQALQKNTILIPPPKLADKDIELRSLAQFASMDLILKAPHKVLPVLPKLILPLKRAFNTRDKKIIIAALKVIQMMVLVGPCVGQALVPYYRQLLAVCNLYKNINVNLGSGVDPDRDRRIGDVIEDTLRLLENCGGPNAFINIKYMIPTYESAVYPKCEPTFS